MDPPLIAKLGLEVQEHFESLIDTIEKSDLHRSETEISSVAVEDELARFRIWAANIGALTSGRASLEYRLRDAEYLHRNVQSLLEILNETLSQGSIFRLSLTL